MHNTKVYKNVDQLEVAAQALGWNIEYQQLNLGSFDSEFGYLENNHNYLVYERFNNHLQINCESPERNIGFFLPILDNGTSLFCGQSMTGSEIVTIPSHCDLELVTKKEIVNYTLFLPEDHFVRVASLIAPSLKTQSQVSASVMQTDLTEFAKIKYLIDTIVRNDCMSRENTSLLLANIILALESTSNRTKNMIDNSMATMIAKRAQTYIEDNFTKVIILDELCQYTGVSLRTLQRHFKQYFQVSPLTYIKACRMNAVRRKLIKADPTNQCITALALNHGFSHLGRFSVDYRVFFGESPTTTLNK